MKSAHSQQYYLRCQVSDQEETSGDSGLFLMKSESEWSLTCATRLHWRHALSHFKQNLHEASTVLSLHCSSVYFKNWSLFLVIGWLHFSCQACTSLVNVTVLHECILRLQMINITMRENLRIILTHYDVWLGVVSLWKEQWLTRTATPQLGI